MAGFIKIHRKLLEWGWYDDSAVKSVFLHLLLTANFKQTEYHGRVIERGQAVFGRESLASALGLSSQQVRTALSKLKSTGEILIESFNKFSVATIPNYEIYQGDDQPTNNQQITSNQPTNNQQITNNQPTINQQITSNQPTNNQQITTSEEGKKERREEIDNITSKPQVDFDAIVGLFNSICVSLPKVTKLTDARKAAIRGAVHRGVDLESLFKAVEASDFLTGRSGGFHGCGFDWIMKPSNQVKIF